MPTTSPLLWRCFSLPRRLTLLGISTAVLLMCTLDIAHAMSFTAWLVNEGFVHSLDDFTVCDSTIPCPVVLAPNHPTKIDLDNPATITGTIPTVLGDVTDLEEFSVGFSLLTGTIPSMTSLQVLDIRDTALELGDFSFLTGLSALVELDISANRHDQTLGNGFTRVFPEELFINELPSLRRIHARGASFVGLLPTALLSSRADWVRVDFEENAFTGTVNDLVTSLLPSKDTLKEMDMELTLISGTIPVALSTFTRLDKLDFDGTCVHGPVPPTLLLNMPLLEQAKFSGFLTRPTMAAPCAAQYGDASTFGILTGPIPQLHPGNTVLTTFLMDNNAFTGTLPTFPPTLEDVNLSHNQLSGDLNSLRACSLPALQNLDLADNQLTGSIPDLSCMTELSEFNLEENQLLGTIPYWFGSMPLLTSLRLESNGLSGAVPSSLQYLTQLTRLTLTEQTRQICAFTDPGSDIAPCGAAGSLVSTSDCSTLRNANIRTCPFQDPASASSVSWAAASSAAYLKASNEDDFDQFGQSVAVSGNIIVVGASHEGSDGVRVNGGRQANDSVENAGAVYVFENRNPAGDWLQQAYLKPHVTPSANEYFGCSVAISGDTIVVGAFGENGSGTGVNPDVDDMNAYAGAAYVFVRFPGGTGWAQQAYLKASNTLPNQQFGYAVAVSHDIIVVGARHESSSSTGVNGDEANVSAASAGAAYVFTRRSDNAWSQQAYLKASNTDTGDQFGVSVGVSGKIIVVGAVYERSSSAGVNSFQADNNAVSAGAAYVFDIVNGGTTWSQVAYLKPKNMGAGDEFGCSVAVSGHMVVVGACLESGSGAAYVFARSQLGSWEQRAYLKASDTGINDRFGASVAIGARAIVVGAPFEDSSSTDVNGDDTSNLSPHAGAAYVFTLDTNTMVWSPQSYLKASNTGSGDQFGVSVALSGDIIVVGADQEAGSSNVVTSSGAAYVLTATGVAPANPVDCQGSFSPYGACSVTCGDGTQTRTFTETTPASDGGAACVSTPLSQTCNDGGACPTPPSTLSASPGASPVAPLPSCVQVTDVSPLNAAWPNSEILVYTPLVIVQNPTVIACTPPSTTSPITFQWTITTTGKALGPLPDVEFNSRVLVLPAFSLNPSQRYTFSLFVDDAAAGSSSVLARSFALDVIARMPVVVIASGSSTTLRVNQSPDARIFIDASQSFDPAYDAASALTQSSPLSYSWTLETPVLTWLDLNGHRAATFMLTSDVIARMPPGTYSFRAHVVSSVFPLGRRSHADILVEVVAGSAPVLTVSMTRIDVHGSVDDAAVATMRPHDTLRLYVTWQYYPPVSTSAAVTTPLLPHGSTGFWNCDDPLSVKTATATSASLLLPLDGSTVTANTPYVFEFAIANVTASYTIIMTSRPRDGTCVVNPTTVVLLSSTPFNIVCSGWRDDTPGALMYSVQQRFLTADGADVTATDDGAPFTTVTNDSPAENVSVYLGVGVSQLRVVVTNGDTGAVTTHVMTQTVTVLPPASDGTTGNDGDVLVTVITTADGSAAPVNNVTIQMADDICRVRQASHSILQQARDLSDRDQVFQLVQLLLSLMDHSTAIEGTATSTSVQCVGTENALTIAELRTQLWDIFFDSVRDIELRDAAAISLALAQQLVEVLVSLLTSITHSRGQSVSAGNAQITLEIITVVVSSAHRNQQLLQKIVTVLSLLLHEQEEVAAAAAVQQRQPSQLGCVQIETIARSLVFLSQRALQRHLPGEAISEFASSAVSIVSLDAGAVQSANNSTLSSSSNDDAASDDGTGEIGPQLTVSIATQQRSAADGSLTSTAVRNSLLSVSVVVFGRHIRRCRAGIVSQRQPTSDVLSLTLSEPIDDDVAMSFLLPVDAVAAASVNTPCSIPASSSSTTSPTKAAIDIEDGQYRPVCYHWTGVDANGDATLLSPSSIVAATDDVLGEWVSEGVCHTSQFYPAGNGNGGGDVGDGGAELVDVLTVASVRCECGTTGQFTALIDCVDVSAEATASDSPNAAEADDLPYALLFATALSLLLLFVWISGRVIISLTKKKKQLSPISQVAAPVLGTCLCIVDFASDLTFASTVGGLPEYNGTLLHLGAYLFLLLPVLVNISMLLRVLRRAEFREFWQWFERHKLAASVIMTLSCLNVGNMRLLSSNALASSEFSAPFTNRQIYFYSVYGVLTNLFEDLPQIIIQVMVFRGTSSEQTHSVRTRFVLVLSLASSVIALAVGLVYKGAIILMDRALLLSSTPELELPTVSARASTCSSLASTLDANKMRQSEVRQSVFDTPPGATGPWGSITGSVAEKSYPVMDAVLPTRSIVERNTMCDDNDDTSTDSENSVSSPSSDERMSPPPDEPKTVGEPARPKLGVQSDVVHQYLDQAIDEKVAEERQRADDAVREVAKLKEQLAAIEAQNVK